MTPELHDWTVPASFSALLWWPPVALVVAMLEPSAAVGTIAVSGAVLAGLGVLVSMVGRAVARRLAGEDAGPLTLIDGSDAPAAVDVTATTVGVEQQAA